MVVQTHSGNNLYQKCRDIMMTNEQQKTRPTTLKEAGKRQAIIFKDIKLTEGFGLVLDSDDVVITPFGKSGTTWLQQIVHTLRTRGDMDFDDISRVIPWIETSSMLGIEIDAPQKARPRAFKSHLSWDAIPKGGRYINSVRNPGDALVSAFKFMEGWFFEVGSVSIDDFANNGFLKSGDYWKHLVSWWQQRNEENVLFLAYEHMKLDLKGTIIQIADFIEIDLDDELLAITEEHASLTFMVKHKDRFDDLLMRKLSEEKGGIPTGSDSSKVRAGNIGESKTVLSAEIKGTLDDIWSREITEKIGFENYDALLAEIPR